MIRVSKPLSRPPLTKPQWPKPKVFGTKGENEVSMPDELSMKQYAHITTKYAKKGHLVKSCHFYLFKDWCTINKLYQPFRHVQRTK